MGGVADAEDFLLALTGTAESEIGMMDPESFRRGPSIGE